MSLEQKIDELTASIKELNQTLNSTGAPVSAPTEAAAVPSGNDKPAEPETPKTQTQGNKKRGRPKNLDEPRYFNCYGQAFKAVTDKDLERMEGCVEINAAHYDGITGENESGENGQTRYWLRDSTHARMMTGPDEDPSKIEMLENDPDVQEVTEDDYRDLEQEDEAAAEPEDDSEDDSEDEADDDLDMDNATVEEVTEEDLKAKLIELKDFGGKAQHKDDVAAIMKRFGASNFKEVEEKHYADCYNAAQAKLDELQG